MVYKRLWFGVTLWRIVLGIWFLTHSFGGMGLGVWFWVSGFGPKVLGLWFWPYSLDL